MYEFLLSTMMTMAMMMMEKNIFIILYTLIERDSLLLFKELLSKVKENLVKRFIVKSFISFKATKIFSVYQDYFQHYNHF